MTGIRIISAPVKTVFMEETDWIRGTWETVEETGEIYLLPSQKISFTHNAGYGAYPDRGMIDMTGLVVEVSYSDGTVSNLKYSEKTNSLGNIYANILVSPKGGKEYSPGTNTLEIYLSENPRYYDSYSIEIVEKNEPLIKSDTALIDYRSHCITGLNAHLTKAQLEGYLSFNGASAEFSKADKSSKFYGTGSTVTVTDSGGNQEVFTIIIYGDISGNGDISNEDVSLVSKAIEDVSALTVYQQKAADINGIRRITVDDLSFLAKIVAAGEELNQFDPSKDVSFR